MFSWCAINSNLMGTLFNFQLYTYKHHSTRRAQGMTYIFEGVAQFEHSSFDCDLV